MKKSVYTQYGIGTKSLLITGTPPQPIEPQITVRYLDVKASGAAVQHLLRKLNVYWVHFSSRTLEPTHLGPLNLDHDLCSQQGLLMHFSCCLQGSSITRYGPHLSLFWFDDSTPDAVREQVTMPTPDDYCYFYSRCKTHLAHNPGCLHGTAR